MLVFFLHLLIILYLSSGRRVDPTLSVNPSNVEGAHIKKKNKRGVSFITVSEGLHTWQIGKLETVQVPNNYSAGCSLHGDVATQGILVSAYTLNSLARAKRSNLIK